MARATPSGYAEQARVNRPDPGKNSDMAYDSSGTGSSAPQKKSRKLAPKQIVATVFIVLAVILVLENTSTQVRVRLIVPEETIHLWIIVVVPLVLGLFAGLLLAHKSRKSK